MNKSRLKKLESRFNCGLSEDDKLYIIFTDPDTKEVISKFCADFNNCGVVVRVDEQNQNKEAGELVSEQE